MMLQPQTQIRALGLDSTARCARWRQVVRGLLAAWVLAGTACGLSDEGKLPPNIPDPTTVRTLLGAIALLKEADRQFAMATDGVVTAGGVFTDELAALPTPAGTIGPYHGLNSRSLNVGSFSPVRLHQARAQAREAGEFFRAYAPDTLQEKRAYAYIMEAYAEIFLADLFCSGIPLSTVNFDGNYTLAAGSTTQEVYSHALALFDTALAVLEGASFEIVGPDNPALTARIGRGRALLALGRYAEAAAAVAEVPDNYRFRPVPVWQAVPGSPLATDFIGTRPPDSLQLVWYWTRPTSSSQNDRRLGAPSIGNLEGGNGLDYRTSADPRTAVLTRGVDPTGNTLFMPSKYTTPGALSNFGIRVGSGVEARLIEAEAALNANPDDGLWLQRLNYLRQTMWTTIFPSVSGPLPVLTDPGTREARVDLLFRERAFWLYLEGHRQSDLRRLVRQYGRSPNTVYPTGAYPGGNGEYGDDVVIPMTNEESQLNPNYVGCFHHNA